jgi:hypothetical protein
MADNPIATFEKDPNAVLDYVIDWGDEWLEAGDEISTSTWTVPTGITKDSDTKTTTTTTIWLSGGTDGVSYDIVNRIVTTGGRTDDRTITIKVRER